MKHVLSYAMTLMAANILTKSLANHDTRNIVICSAILSIEATYAIGRDVLRWSAARNIQATKEVA